MAEISRRAGCSRRSIWNHFPDVEAAILEVVLPDELAKRLFPRAGADSAVALEVWEAAAGAALTDGSLAPLDLGVLVFDAGSAAASNVLIAGSASR
ncbi:AcrR family transcriptional regulator [Microbacterium trichothecenolyticum]|nr:AcrR family transcriptional regulator [Microbacterium trichothecenolyticum]